MEAVTYFWQQISHPNETRFNEVKSETAIKYNFSFSAAGDAGEKGIFGSVFKFEIFYSGSETSVTHSKFTEAD